MPRERGGKAYERAVEARGAIRAAQAGANDHDAPNPGRCMAPPKRSDASLMMTSVYKIRVTNQSESH